MCGALICGELQLSEYAPPPSITVLQCTLLCVVVWCSDMQCILQCGTLCCSVCYSVCSELQRSEYVPPPPSTTPLQPGLSHMRVCMCVCCMPIAHMLVCTRCIVTEMSVCVLQWRDLGNHCRERKMRKARRQQVGLPHINVYIVYAYCPHASVHMVYHHDCADVCNILAGHGRPLLRAQTLGGWALSYKCVRIAPMRVRIQFIMMAT